MNKEDIIIKYDEFISKIVKCFYLKFKKYNIEYEDLYQESMLIVLKNIKKINKSSNQEEYIFDCVFNELIHYVLSNLSKFDIDYEAKKNSYYLDERTKKVNNNIKLSDSEMLAMINDIIVSNRNKNSLKYIKELLIIKDYCFNDKVISLDEVDEEYYISDINNEIVFSESVEDIMNQLRNTNPKKFEIFAYRYGLFDNVRKSFAVVGREFNYHESSVNSIITKYKNKLLNDEEKLKKIGLV